MVVNIRVRSLDDKPVDKIEPELLVHRNIGPVSIAIGNTDIKNCQDI